MIAVIFLNFNNFEMEIGFREIVLSTLNPVANEELHVESVAMIIML